MSIKQHKSLFIGPSVIRGSPYGHSTPRKSSRYGLGTPIALIIPVGTHHCEEGFSMNAGDTAFLLLSAALVMLMTPGLALFYGGMVRRKNVLGTIMQSFIIIGLVSVEWVLVGYSMTFGPDHGGIIGDLTWFGLRGVGLDPYPDYVATVPHQAFMVYQMMFAVMTPALITGAFAERFKFSTFLLFTLLWSLLVYNPVAHRRVNSRKVENLNRS